MRSAVVLVSIALLAAACASRTAPEREVPYCLAECPPPAEVVGELSVAVARPGGPVRREIVTGAELERMTSGPPPRAPLPADLWIYVDSAGVAHEIRVAESSGSERNDEAYIQSAADITYDVSVAGWYRVRVRPGPRL